MRLVPRVGAIALMVMLGVLLVFFFPATSGPFSVTNGPATAFRALAAARGIFAAMNAALLVAAVLRCVVYLKFMTQTTAWISYDPELFDLRC